MEYKSMNKYWKLEIILLPLYRILIDNRILHLVTYKLLDELKNTNNIYFYGMAINIKY